MAECNTDKSLETKKHNFKRHEKNTEERRNRQAAALRANLKKRKDQIRQRKNSN